MEKSDLILKQWRIETSNKIGLERNWKRIKKIWLKEFLKWKF